MTSTAAGAAALMVLRSDLSAERNCLGAAAMEAAVFFAGGPVLMAVLERGCESADSELC